jgi:hypothetical protein
MARNKRSPASSGRHAAGSAGQEPDAEALFEFSDGMAQRRLRNAKFRCCIREAALLSYGDESYQLIQVSALHL